jgi:hypothetical protein
MVIESNGKINSLKDGIGGIGDVVITGEVHEEVNVGSKNQIDKITMGVISREQLAINVLPTSNTYNQVYIRPKNTHIIFRFVTQPCWEKTKTTMRLIIHL